MAASPPGWGPPGIFSWLARLVSHVAGLFAGALVTGLFLYGLFTLVPDPPSWVFAGLAALLALVVAGVIPVDLEGSRWRVPQSWSRFGRYGYPAAFGVALGAGWATRLSSPGAYLLFAWAVVAPEWAWVWPVFVAFAAGRAVPFLVVSLISAKRHTHSADQLESIVRTTRPLVAVEALVLALTASWALAGDAPGDTTTVASPRTSPDAAVVLLTETAVVGLTAGDLSERWRQGIGSASLDAATLAGDVVVLTGDGAASRLVRIHGASGRIRARTDLPKGYAYGAVVVSRDRSRIYAIGRRAAPAGAIAVVTVDAARNAVTRTIEVPKAGPADWDVHRAASYGRGDRLIISYHGRDTTGADILTPTGDGTGGAACPPARPNEGCIGVVHGAVVGYGDGAVAATGQPVLVLLDASGAILREFDTRLAGNHLMEFAVDPAGHRIYALGPCGYTGGLSQVDIDRGAVTVVRPPRSPEVRYDDTMCGDRVAVIDDARVIVTADRRAILVDVADGRQVAQYSAPAPIQAVAVTTA